MPIEGIVVAQGRGTVVTGKVERGKIKIGDELEVVGSRTVLKTFCVGIEMFRKILDYAEVGDNIGVLLKNVHNKEVFKGNMLCAPKTIFSHTTFKAHVFILSEKEGGRSKPFKTGYKPQFFFRVSNITGAVILDGDEETIVMPGDTVNMTIKLIEKAIINVGLRFVIREGRLTVGAGIISEIIE
jgi:elongation factor Tu